MAHDIHEDDIFAYHGAPGWHGLGLQLPADVRTCGEAARRYLPWRAETVQLSYPGGVLAPVMGIRRSDTLRHLGVCSPRYVPVQNDTLARAADLIAAEVGGTLETLGSLGHGKNVYFLVHTGGFTLRAEDRTEQYLLVTGAHDGSGAVRLYPTTVRVVCRNTLVASSASAAEGAAIRHTGAAEAEVMVQAAALAEALKASRAMEEQARALAAQPASFDTRYDYWRAVSEAFGVAESRVEARIGGWSELHDRDPARGTLWGAFNAVTEDIDHGSRRGGRLERILLGRGAAQKTKALNLALALI